MNADRTLPSKTLRFAGLAQRALVGSGAAFVLIASPGSAAAAGDPLQGAQAFRNCVACHSIDAGQNMTGPTLASVLGRKAGGLASFHRYSDALKRSGIVWSEQTLDAWIANPAAFIPGNDMRFQGIGGGQTLKFWEFNLRFKSDSSSRGPRKGEPVLAGQGMQGDRAQIVFSSPAEI